MYAVSSFAIYSNIFHLLRLHGSRWNARKKLSTLFAIAYQRSNFPEKPIAGHTWVFHPNYATHARPKGAKIETSRVILCVGFKMDFLPFKLMQKYHTLLNNLWSPADWFLLKFRLRSINGSIFESILFHKFLTRKWHGKFFGSLPW